MKFSHLHVHSHYSLLDGLPKIDALLDYVKELGMDSVALTDHGALYGAVEFYKKAKAKGIKPIIGAELYVAYERMSDKRPNIDDKKYHLVLLVKNEQGYKNLVKLITKSHLEGFYYKPRVDEELLAEHSEGLIALSACLKGKVPRQIINGNLEGAEETALKYQKIFGPENFYLEVQEHLNIPEQQKANEAIIALAKKHNIPLVATNDSHYLRPEDAQAQDILMLINTGAKIDDPERLTMKNEDFSMKKPEQMIAFCRDFPEAIENTQKIVDMCGFEFLLGETKLPHFETPAGKSADDYLSELCEQGLIKKKTHIEDEAAARERLAEELGVIIQTGFASYFLIVQDFVNWAKENRIAVSCRGSAAGSLVSYLLNISEVNPLKYDLLFERFLNKDRISMPDIDLDFADRRRDEVIAYVAQKYGAAHVAQIITFGTMAARAVIRDVGRAMALPYSFCDQIAKMIPPKFKLAECLKKVSEFKQLYESDEQAKTLIDEALKLEGVARHASTHACGIVISKEPLSEIVPLQHPTQNDENIVTQYEMHAIDDLGLLKMDLLGLKNLTIIEDTLAKIYVIRKEKLTLEQIPLDDKKTFKLLQEAKTTSVFQLESSGMKRYLKELKPTTIDDIAAMVALYRPGPMELIPDYIARKHHKKDIEYIYPTLETVLKTTYGLPIFQEQIMQIARILAGFTLSEADILRKAIGKKIKELLQAQKQRFIDGCVKNNVSREIAEKVFSWIEPHASYSFNKSHAVVYATIAYQTAYLKTHYPLEFMASVMTAEKADVERVAFLIDESKAMGIDVLPPDINESFRQFSVVTEPPTTFGSKVVGGKIRFGLLAIKNVGANIVEAIVSERKRGGPFLTVEDFVGRVASKDLNKRSLEALIKAGVFDKIAERNQLLVNLEKLLEWARKKQQNIDSGQKGLFDNHSTFKNASLAMAVASPATEQEKLEWEKELLGLFVTSHPLKAVKHIIAAQAIALREINRDLLNKRVKIGGIISSIKRIVTKAGQPMAFVNLEDQTSRVEVVAFPGILERNPDAFQTNKIVFVSGRVDMRDGSPKIIAETIEEIVEA